jgi:hypothetical protein
MSSPGGPDAEWSEDFLELPATMGRLTTWVNGRASANLWSLRNRAAVSGLTGGRWAQIVRRDALQAQFFERF